MRARSLMAMAAVAAAISAGGCGSDDGVQPGERPRVESRVADRSEVTSRGRADVYGPDNPYTAETVARLLRRPDVDRVAAQFEALGLAWSPGDCSVIEGTSDGRAVVATFLAFSAAGGESGVLACFESDGRMTLAPAIFTPDTADRAEATEGLRVDTTPFPPGSSEDAERWSPEQWNQFWECMLVRAPGPVTACFSACLFIGPGYFHCALACTVTQSAAAVVHCVIQVSFAGDETRSKEPRTDG